MLVVKIDDLFCLATWDEDGDLVCIEAAETMGHLGVKLENAFNNGYVDIEDVKKVVESMDNNE